jgi:hypothetical protein
MLIIIVSIVIYTIIAFIFGCLCYDNFVSVTDLAWILGLLWGIVLPFMIIYALLNTIINYTPICKKKQQDFRDFRRCSHLIYIC